MVRKREKARDETRRDETRRDEAREGKRHPCERNNSRWLKPANQFQDRKLIGRIPGVFHRAAKYTAARAPGPIFSCVSRPWGRGVVVRTADAAISDAAIGIREKYANAGRKQAVRSRILTNQQTGPCGDHR